MSNLQLPTMSYENLSTLSVGSSGKIGYATHIDRDEERERITVFHHGHPISIIGRDWVTLDNCGYHTRTTADRLNRIATANGIGRVGIRQGVMRFTPADGEPVYFERTGASRP